MLNVLPVAVADYLADVRAPGVCHALLGDGVVVGDLLPHQFAHVRKVAAVRKVADDRDAQNAPVGQAAVCVAGLAVFKQHLAVSLDQDDVRVIVGDGKAHRILSGTQGQGDGKHNVALVRQYADRAHLHKARDLRLLCLRNLADHLEDLVLLARDDARDSCSLDALEAAGVGHHHALDVFDDVAAGHDLHALGQTAQNGARLRSAVGDGNRLRAAHGGHELLAQNLYQMCIARVILLHTRSPLSVIVG